MIRFLALICGCVSIFLFLKIWYTFSQTSAKVETARSTGRRASNNDIDDINLQKKAMLATAIAAILLLGYWFFGGKNFSASANQAGNNSEPDTPALHVPSDPTGSYKIISKSRENGQAIIVTKRTGTSGTTWSQRAYDCTHNTVMYIGSGETYAGMKSSSPDAAMAPVTAGSIADYVGREACR